MSAELLPPFPHCYFANFSKFFLSEYIMDELFLLLRFTLVQFKARQSDRRRRRRRRRWWTAKLRFCWTEATTLRINFAIWYEHIRASSKAVDKSCKLRLPPSDSYVFNFRYLKTSVFYTTYRCSIFNSNVLIPKPVQKNFMCTFIVW